MKDEKAAHEKNQPKKPAGASAMRAKRPATIDLKATEIKPEPAGAPEPSTSAAPPPPPPEPTATASSDTGSAAETAPPRDAWRGVQERLPKGLAWPAIGIAAAAAIVFFAVGLGAGQWLSGRTNSQPASVQVAAQTPPELLERIARLEAQLSASQKQDPQLQARLARLETSLNAARKDDPQLQARLAKLEAQLNAPTANDQQLMARIAAAEAAVKTLVDMTASREKRSDDIAALAREARDRASSAASAAEAVQKAQSGPSESRADIDALTTRIVTLEQSAKASQAELARRLSADDAKGRFAIAAIALRDSVDRSLPFSAELAAVKSLSGDTSAVAALEPFVASGVPSAETLGRELAGLMPSVWKIARKEQPQPGTFLERLQFNAEKIVRIRPAGEAVGDDPASVRARIETRAGNADIRGALAELSKLPPDARVPADAWIKRAQARNAAIAAARNISQAALGALVKPGS